MSYADRRLEELYAAAPKPKKTVPYANLRLTTAAKACAALDCKRMMLYVWLVHKAKVTSKLTVPVPNGILAKYGIDRKMKHRTLRQLEAAGLVMVERRSRKTPLVTLL